MLEGAAGEVFGNGRCCWRSFWKFLRLETTRVSARVDYGTVGLGVSRGNWPSRV